MSAAISKTYGGTNLTVDDIVRSAFLEAGAISSLITAEMVNEAILHINRMFGVWAQRGVLLWTTEKIGVRTSVGQKIIDSPIGTNKILFAYRRSCTFSDSTNPHTYNPDEAILDLGAEQEVSDVYFTLSAIPSSSVVVSGSADGVTYTTVQETPVYKLLAASENYVLLNNVAKYQYIKLSTTGGVTFSNFEAGWRATDLILSSISRDIYEGFPDKSFMGRPLQYWPERTTDGYRLHLWPVSHSSSNVIVITFRRQISDVETLNQNLDIPRTWYDAIIYGLAHRIVHMVQPATRRDTGELIALADKHLAIAFGDEADMTPHFITPYIRPYTR